VRLIEISDFKVMNVCTQFRTLKRKLLALIDLPALAWVVTSVRCFVGTSACITRYLCRYLGKYMCIHTRPHGKYVHACVPHIHRGRQTDN
jgi:hypothetical protein